jgi:hypothetical protein
MRRSGERSLTIALAVQDACRSGQRVKVILNFD